MSDEGRVTRTIETVSSDEQILTDAGFYWRDQGPVRVLVCRELEAVGFTNGFSTRLGGVSSFPANDLNLAGYDEDAAENIEENRRRFLAAFPPGYKLAVVWQIHSDRIKLVRDESEIEMSDDKYDAVISTLPRVLAGVKTADCVPVLIGDRGTGAFAAIHAGWRGTVNSIVAKTVDRMRNEFGTSASDLVCAIGPAATCESYEIGQDVIDEFTARFEDGAKYFKPTREGHALVDLHAANRDQLSAAGVGDANIFIAPLNTMNRTDLFFSYRVEKKKYGKTGRLLSVVGRI
jgi:YfiH family protein